MARVCRPARVWPRVSGGTGTGTDFCTPEKPVTVARVDGFDPISNSARKRERLPAQHSKLCISGHHNHQLPQKHEQGGEMHHPFPQKVCYLLNTISSIYANLNFTESMLFPTTHHPQKRARVLDF